MNPGLERENAESNVRRWYAFAVLACLISLAARWVLADLASWDSDESGTLWLGREMAQGRGSWVGLPSSRDIPQLAGASIISAPLSLLPDLLNASRGLSMLQFVALLGLGVTIGRTAYARAVALAVLILFPGVVLASFGFWNNYMTMPFTAASMAGLLMVAREDTSPRTRSLAVALTAAFLLFLPTVHLVCFADLAIGSVLLVGLTLFRASLLHIPLMLLGLAVVATPAFWQYGEWISYAVGEFSGDRAIYAWYGVALIVTALAGLLFLWWMGAKEFLIRTLEGLGQSRAASYALLFLVIGGVLLSVIAANFGVLPMMKFLGAAELAAFLLLAGHIGLGLSFRGPIRHGLAVFYERLPAAAWLREWSCHRSAETFVALMYMGLVVSARLVVMPTLFSPIGGQGRSDLLVPLIPVLLTPVLLYAVARPSVLGTLAKAATFSALVLIYLMITAPTAAYHAAWPRRVAASEIRDVVDWIAEHAPTSAAGPVVNVCYFPAPAPGQSGGLVCERDTYPGIPTSLAGLPYDLLFERRHKLRNISMDEDVEADVPIFYVVYRTGTDDGPADGLDALMLVDVLESTQLVVKMTPEDFLKITGANE